MNVLRMEAGDGFWQRGTKTRANTMVENKIFLQSPKNTSFDNVIFLLKVCYTSAFKTPFLGDYFTVYTYLEIRTLIATVYLY